SGLDAHLLRQNEKRSQSLERITPYPGFYEHLTIHLLKGVHHGRDHQSASLLIQPIDAVGLLKRGVLDVGPALHRRPYVPTAGKRESCTRRHRASGFWPPAESNRKAANNHSISRKPDTNRLRSWPGAILRWGC